MQTCENPPPNATQVALYIVQIFTLLVVWTIVEVFTVAIESFTKAFTMVRQGGTPRGTQFASRG